MNDTKAIEALRVAAVEVATTASDFNTYELGRLASPIDRLEAALLDLPTATLDAAAQEREAPAWLIDRQALWNHMSGEVEDCRDPWGNHGDEIAWCGACYADAIRMLAGDSKSPTAVQAREYRAQMTAGTARIYAEECEDNPCRCSLRKPEPERPAPGQIEAWAALAPAAAQGQETER